MKLIVKYPKFLLLFLTFILAYFIFTGRNFQPLIEFLNSLGYFGTFLLGILFAYGFTAAPATAIFLILAKTQNIFVASILGGLGCMCGDFIIFKLIRSSFQDEINKIEHEKVMRKISRSIPKKIKHYLIPLFADLIIASPLPDEIGVSMLAVSGIRTKLFALLSFTLNTIGIFVVVLIGQVL